MSDTAQTDMTAFLERHDRQSRRVFVAMICASLVVSVVVFTQGVQAHGSAAALGKLWFPILVYPALLAAFWIAVTLWKRKQPKPPGGRFLMNPDDARNIARVANGGFAFVVGFATLMIGSQVAIALEHFGVVPALYEDGALIGRATLVASGILTAYFGNAWSRMPVPRAPDQQPAMQMRFRRVFAWLIVIHGLLLALGALTLPSPAMIAATAVVSCSMMLSVTASIVLFRKALKPHRASSTVLG